MNQLQRNCRLIIESWVANWREHKRNRYVRREIRKHGRQLKEARKEADLMHKATGKTYYCLVDYNGEMRVLDKMGVRGLKKFKVMDKAVTFIDLLNEAEYNTANNQFLVLTENPKLKGWLYMMGTIDECLERIKIFSEVGDTVTILTGMERVVTIKNGNITKH